MSWIIRNKITKEVLFETYDSRKAAALNTAKYEAVEAHSYLGELNREIARGRQRRISEPKLKPRSTR